MRTNHDYKKIILSLTCFMLFLTSCGEKDVLSSSSSSIRQAQQFQTTLNLTSYGENFKTNPNNVAVDKQDAELVLYLTQSYIDSTYQKNNGSEELTKALFSIDNNKYDLFTLSFANPIEKINSPSVAVKNPKTNLDGYIDIKKINSLQLFNVTYYNKLDLTYSNTHKIGVVIADNVGPTYKGNPNKVYTLPLTSTTNIKEEVLRIGKGIFKDESGFEVFLKEGQEDKLLIGSNIKYRKNSFLVYAKDPYGNKSNIYQIKIELDDKILPSIKEKASGDVLTSDVIDLGFEEEILFYNGLQQEIKSRFLSRYEMMDNFKAMFEKAYIKDGKIFVDVVDDSYNRLTLTTNNKVVNTKIYVPENGNKDEDGLYYRYFDNEYGSYELLGPYNAEKYVIDNDRNILEIPSSINNIPVFSLVDNFLNKFNTLPKGIYIPSSVKHINNLCETLPKYNKDFVIYCECSYAETSTFRCGWHAYKVNSSIYSFDVVYNVKSFKQDCENNFDYIITKDESGQSVAYLYKASNLTGDVIIPAYAFKGDEKIPVVSILPNAITLTNATSLTILEGVKSIQEKAINHGNIKNLDLFIPESLTILERDAFYSDKNVYLYLVCYCPLAEEPDGWSHGFVDYGSISYKLAFYEDGQTDTYGFSIMNDNGRKAVDITDYLGDLNVSELTIPNTITYKGVTYPVRNAHFHSNLSFPNLKKLIVSEGVLSCPADYYDMPLLEEIYLPVSYGNKINFVAQYTNLKYVYAACPSNQLAYDNEYSSRQYRVVFGYEYSFKNANDYDFDIAHDEKGNKYAILQKYYGLDGNITTPLSVDYNGTPVPVKYLNQHLYEKKPVESLTVSEGIVSIPEYFAYKCPLLKSVSFPESLVYIQDYAFAESTQLATFNLPNNLFYIGYFAFNNIAQIDELTLPERCTSILSNAFNTIGTVYHVFSRNIQQDAFKGCKRTVTYEPGEKITTADGYECFIPKEQKENENVVIINNYVGQETNIVVPYSLTINNVTYKCKFANGDIYKNSSIETLEFDEKYTSTPMLSFADLKTLKTVKFHNGLLSTGELSFSRSGVTNVICGSNIRYISCYFINCVDLLSFTNIDNVTHIYERAFDGCTNFTLSELPSNLKYVGSFAFNNCPKVRITELPEKLTKIGQSAFAGCNLPYNSLTINKFNNEIAKYAFDGVPTDFIFYVTGPNHQFADKWNYTKDAQDKEHYCVTFYDFDRQIIFNDVMYGIYKDENNNDYAKALRYVGNNDELIVPNTIIYNNKDVPVKELAPHFVCHNETIKTIRLPERLDNIPKEVFIDNPNLENVYLNSITPILRENTIVSCYNIKEVFLTSDIDVIKRDFINTGGIAKAPTIYVDHEKGANWDEYYHLFDSYDNPDGTTNYNNYADVYYNVYSNLQVSDDGLYQVIGIRDKNDLGVSIVKCLKPETLKGDYTLPEYITLSGVPTKVIEIKNDAFSKAAFVTVRLSQYIRIIGDHAFKSCKNLEKAYIPFATRYIGSQAFLYSTYLNTIYIGSPRSHYHFASDWNKKDYNNNLFTNIIYGYTGVEFTVDDLKYELFVDYNLKTRARLIKYVGTSDVISVPNVVTYNNQEYEVNQMKEWAFYNVTFKKLYISQGVYFEKEWFKDHLNSTIYSHQDYHSYHSETSPGFVDVSSVVVIDDVYYAIQGTNAAVVIAYKGNKENVVIKDQVPAWGRLNDVYCIEDDIFYGNENVSNIKSINIPSSVKKIYSNSLKGLTNATINLYEDISITRELDAGWEQNNTVNKIQSVIEYEDSDGFVYELHLNTDNLAKYCAIKGYKGSNSILTIPDFITYNGANINVTRILDNAFKDNARLFKVTIGKNIRSIGCNAFANCSALSEVYMPINVEFVKKNSFANPYSELKFYCEHESEPYYFDTGWNANCPVTWGYKFSNLKGAEFK